MKYLTYFILFIIFAHPLGAFAEGNRYRVEVLVLRHLDHAEQPEEVSGLDDYSAALDFLIPPEEEEEIDCQPFEDPAPDPDAATAPADTDPLEPPLDEEPEPIDPNEVVHVTEMGPEMQDAWRRLRLSAPFRPLQYLAWEQGEEAPFPVLRIHDGGVVLTDDPYSDLREAEDEFAAIYGDTGTMIEETDTAPRDCLETVDTDPLPDPTLYYALDGNVSLIRTRFLHLNLDLELREPVWEIPEDTARSDSLHALLPGDGETPREAAAPQPSFFRVHRLQQSRQVRSGRMEYFDGPVIGVLAWITAVPLEDIAER